jgi:hypothetical protein
LRPGKTDMTAYNLQGGELESNFIDILSGVREILRYQS